MGPKELEKVIENNKKEKPKEIVLTPEEREWHEAAFKRYAAKYGLETKICDKQL